MRCRPGTAKAIAFEKVPDQRCNVPLRFTLRRVRDREAYCTVSICLSAGNCTGAFAADAEPGSTPTILASMLRQ